MHVLSIYLKIDMLLSNLFYNSFITKISILAFQKNTISILHATSKIYVLY